MLEVDKEFQDGVSVIEIEVEAVTSPKTVIIYNFIVIRLKPSIEKNTYFFYFTEIQKKNSNMFPAQAHFSKI